MRNKLESFEPNLRRRCVALKELGFRYLTRDMDGRIVAWMNKPNRVVYCLAEIEDQAKDAYGEETFYFNTHLSDYDGEDDNMIRDGYDTKFCSFSCSKEDDREPHLYSTGHLELFDKNNDFKLITWENSPVEINTLINMLPITCAGINMTNWDFSDYKDPIFIYKAFVAVCNYAEEHIPCGNCPLYKICFSDNNAEKEFWEKVYNKLEINVEK
ncbi:hypothetical protein [Lacrimispora amygdalina]|uniref:hypothetical protein n=1 Tax=Lacrimispora amygdalina TaxID=253257 RepID=UPI000BE2B87E|nr:hypothetical protein [Lacrimispora amygdalina]